MYEVYSDHLEEVPIQYISTEWILQNVTSSLDIESGCYGCAYFPDGRKVYSALCFGCLITDKIDDAIGPCMILEIEQKGITHPINIFLRGENYCIGNGHHRLTAAILLGLDSIPVLLTTDEYWNGTEESDDGDYIFNVDESEEKSLRKNIMEVVEW